MNPIEYLLLGVEQYLRQMSDDDFAELVQRARPPAGGADDNSRASFARNLFSGGND